MTSNMVFKLVVSEGDKDVFSTPLSCENVSTIVSNFPETPENNKLFLLASKHPASSVRQSIAYKELSSEVVAILSQDTSIEVLRCLSQTASFRDYANFDLLVRLINLDVQIAQNIAQEIEGFDDSTKLIEVLAKHTDPAVAYSLAGNSNVPKKVLKTLTNHSDPYVADEARSRLEDYS